MFLNIIGVADALALNSRGAMGNLYDYKYFICLTLKHQETHGCVVNTVATDGLVRYPQCWLNIHSIGPASYKTIAHKVNNIRKWNHILKKMTQSLKG